MVVYVVTYSQPTYCGNGCSTDNVIGVCASKERAEQLMEEHHKEFNESNEYWRLENTQEVFEIKE